MSGVSMMFKFCQQQRKILYWTLGLGILVGIIVFIYSAYHYQLGWTGFVKDTTTEVTRERKTETSPIEKFPETTIKTTKYQAGKTLWDWLELLIVPFLIAGFGLWFQSEQDKRERAIAQINSAEEAIEAYLKSMADILLNEEFTKKLYPDDNKSNSSDKDDKDNPVRDVARALTIAILRRLEGNRRHQDVILRFLRDAELHEFILKNAHLSEMDLSATSLWRFNLSGAKLRNTNLSKADLEETNLSEANLSKANLNKANLSEADLSEADLSKACLLQADLSSANPKKCTCWIPEERIREKAYEIWEERQSKGKPDTPEDNWKKAKRDLKKNLIKDKEKNKPNLFSSLMNFLKQTDLYGANLKDADLYGANLKDADLYGANLKDADLN